MAPPFDGPTTLWGSSEDTRGSRNANRSPGDHKIKSGRSCAGSRSSRPIFCFDAEALITLRHSAPIQKTCFPCRGAAVWDIDVFAGETTALTVAETERRHETETFECPAWLGRSHRGNRNTTTGRCHKRPLPHWLASQRFPSLVSQVRRIGKLMV